MKPILYVQKSQTTKHLSFDFCYTAMLGAEEMEHTIRTFTNFNDIPNKPNHIVVGSVEQCQGWLKLNNYEIPQAIDINQFSEFLKRKIFISHTSEIEELLKSGPIFIKPANKIKAFTGFQVDNKLMFDLFSEGYQGDILVQDVLDIISEYRIYVTDGKIVGCKHYSGDFLKFPQGHIINSIFQKAKQMLTHHSYTIDVAVLEDGTTALIELNDGWACGNYGLEPLDYYLFCRNRWLQITGLRK